MFMGEGIILILSRNQKLNTGSSTEAELLGISDALGLMMYTKYFMEAQGYSIDSNILFQDNQSTILLANTGRSSAGKESKHIKNCYLLIIRYIRRTWKSTTILQVRCWLVINQIPSKESSSAPQGPNL